MKLLARLFCWMPICLFSAELYLLPQRHHDAAHMLCERIEKANGPVEIFTPSLDRRDLLSCVAETAKRGNAVSLYSAEIAPQLSAALRYEGVSLHRIVVPASETSPVLTFSLLMTPETACVLSTTMTHDALTRQLGLLECTSDAEAAQPYRTIGEALKRYAEPYLDQP